MVNGDRPAWWNICQKCGNTLDWDWSPTNKGPVYFEISGHRMILCKQCARVAWDMERLAQVVNGD